MNAIEWLDELREASATVEGPRLMTLATIAGDGSPRARTLVLRGIEAGGSLLACSDARTETNTQLKRDARAEAVLWFPAARKQFRLRGSVTILPDGAARQRIWDEMKPNTRAVFAWPHPGAPRAEEDDEAWVKAIDDGEPVPENFEVLRLVPDEVDRLDLTPAPHWRTRWERAGKAWQATELNP